MHFREASGGECVSKRMLGSRDLAASTCVCWAGGWKYKGFCLDSKQLQLQFTLPLPELQVLSFFLVYRPLPVQLKPLVSLGNRSCSSGFKALFPWSKCCTILFLVAVWQSGRLPQPTILLLGLGAHSLLQVVCLLTVINPS